MVQSKVESYPLVCVLDVSLWPARAKLRRLCEQHASLLKVTDAVLDKLIQLPDLNDLMLKLKDEAHKLFLLYTAFSNVGPSSMKLDIGDTEYVCVRRILDEDPGIKFRVDEAVIKKYYRKLSRRYHPDIGTQPDRVRFGLAHAAFMAKDMETLYLMLNASLHELSLDEEEELVNSMVRHMTGVLEKFRGGVSFKIAACYVAGGKIKAQLDLEAAIRLKIRACELLRMRNPQKATNDYPNEHTESSEASI